MSSVEFFQVIDDNFVKNFDEIVVIGDIHGCNDEFEELLNKIHDDSPSKNSGKSLKILVGDLVNKGPFNEQVLKNCCETYASSILAVRGNHDEVVLRQWGKFKASPTSYCMLEKNNWIKSLPEHYIQYLKNLPFTITIPSLNCIIVHAGLNPFIQKDLAAKDLKNRKYMVTMRNIVKETQMLTKEKNIGEAWANFWDGPQHVYFGHDARRRLQDKHPFATGLDTGCVYGDRLSGIYIKGPKTGQIISIKAKRIYEAIQD